MINRVELTSTCKYFLRVFIKTLLTKLEIECYNSEKLWLCVPFFLSLQNIEYIITVLETSYTLLSI